MSSSNSRSSDVSDLLMARQGIACKTRQCSSQNRYGSSNLSCNATRVGPSFLSRYLTIKHRLWSAGWNAALIATCSPLSPRILVSLDCKPAMGHNHPNLSRNMKVWKRNSAIACPSKRIALYAGQLRRLASSVMYLLYIFYSDNL